LSRTDALGWQRTSPLAVLFFIGKILGGLAKNATQVIAPLAAFFVAFPGSAQTKIALAAAAFLIYTTTSSLLRYWFFRFQIGEDAILVREGVVNKKQLDIKFKRIQGINTEQSFVYRWFGLVTISFDTAGSAGSEAELPAVEAELATALRERIGKVSKDVPDAEDDERAAEATPLLKLNWRDMVRIGLADRRAFVFLAVIAPFFEQISEEFGQAIANQIEDVAEDVAAMGPAIAATVLGTVVLIVVAMLVIGSIIAAFLRYHNFALYLDGSRLRSVGGLLTRHEATMETGKVQVARISQGLVLRWSQRIRIVLKQASSKTQRASKSFLVPAAPTGFQQPFLGDVFAPEATGLDLDFDSDSLERVDVRFVRPRILFGALLPVLLLAPLAWIGAGPLVIAILLWVPLWCLIQWQMWRRLAWYVNADALIRRKGVIGKQLDVFLLRKVQRITLTQSRYQRRKALAMLTFYLASGRIKLPYMPLTRAETVRDYVLYKVESSTKPWH
jgi:putative membrane protein